MSASGCAYFTAFTVAWVVAVAAWLYGLYFQLRARSHVKPQSLAARFASPLARFRASSYAPVAAPLVVRSRWALLVFAAAVIVGLSIGELTMHFAATTCVL